MHLNAKCKTTELLGYNRGENSDYFGFGNDSLDTTPKHDPQKK